MALATRKSVLAITRETTSGTPVLPTSGVEFIGLQDGFSLTPNFNQIDNAELSPNIGSKAPILTTESPEVSVSHYVRHSGVEATAPNYDLLFESAFGSKVAAIAQQVTIAASTAGTASVAAIIKVGGGIGALLERGKALLIKDSINGYSIRNIESIATDDLTLGFNLSGAPAAGVGLGRAILYKPADSAPSMTCSLYRANGGAIEAVAGAKVASMTVTAEAGGLLNAEFSLAGTGFYYDPIEITSSDRYLDFTDDAGTFAAIVAAKLYKDPHELAAALQEAMDLVTTTTPTVTYSNTTGKFTIKTTGTILSLLWNSGANTANTVGDKIGFLTAANDTGIVATTGYTSDNAITLTAPYTPVADTNVNPLVVKYNELLIGSFDNISCSNAQSMVLNLENTQQDIVDICAESGISEKLNSARVVSVDVVLTTQAYDAEKFKRYRAGDDIRLMFNGGVKVGGNWVPGRCVNMYFPQCKISSIENSDSDGVVVTNLTLTPYVPASGSGEAYLNVL